MLFRIVAAICLLALPVSTLADEPFALRDGDRVVLLGGGLIEQERLHGHVEARLTAGAGSASIPFRNLGWGGDTVRGVARTGGYQAPDGLARALKETKDLRPTALILGYGMNESFDGPAGLPAFVADYEKLLDQLAPLKARVILLSPTPHEDLGRPLPDPAEHNAALEQYTAAIKELAARRGTRFVDLFHPLQAAKKTDRKTPLTTNGITLTAAGDAAVARAVADQLGVPPAAYSEAYRAAIVHRNALFYRRWRPFNDHSRHWGFMKGDYALYDQEIAAAEQAIVRARTNKQETK